jgi:hypothetical protein
MKKSQKKFLKKQLVKSRVKKTSVASGRPRVRVSKSTKSHEEEEEVMEEVMESGFIGSGSDSGSSDDGSDSGSGGSDSGSGSSENDGESDYDDPETMQQELLNLKVNDPSFYQYLKENDSNLLEFNNSEARDGSEVGEEGGSDEDLEEEGGSDEDLEEEVGDINVEKDQQSVQPSKNTGKEQLLLKIHKLRVLLSQKSSLSAWKKSISLLTSLLDGSSGDASRMSEPVSPRVLNLMVLVVVRYSFTVLSMHVGNGSSKETNSSALKGTKDNVVVNTSKSKYAHLKPKIKALFKNILVVLGMTTDGGMIRFVLVHLRRLVPFLVGAGSGHVKDLKSSKGNVVSVKLVSQIRHKLIELITYTGSLSSKDGGVHSQINVLAFLTLREVCLCGGGGSGGLEKCLGALVDVYVNWKPVRGHESTSAREVEANEGPSTGGQVGRHKFLESCIVELAGMSLHLTYGVLFGMMRGFAMVLRSVTSGVSNSSNGGGKGSSKGKGGPEEVKTWKNLYLLRIWGVIIARYTQTGPGHGQSELDDQSEQSTHKTTHATLQDSTILFPLIYPLVQLTLCLCDLSKSNVFLPLRLHLLRDVSRLTSVYIPLGGYFLETLEMLISSPCRYTPLPPLQFFSSGIDGDGPGFVRIPEEYLGSLWVCEQGVKEWIEVFEAWYANGFVCGGSECGVLVCMGLRKIVKRLLNGSSSQVNGKGKGAKGKGGRSTSKIAKLLMDVVRQIEINSDHVLKIRDGMSVAPRDCYGVGGTLGSNGILFLEEGGGIEELPFRKYLDKKRKVMQKVHVGTAIEKPEVEKSEGKGKKNKKKKGRFEDDGMDLDVHDDEIDGVEDIVREFEMFSDDDEFGRLGNKVSDVESEEEDDDIESDS